MRNPYTPPKPKPKKSILKKQAEELRKQSELAAQLAQYEDEKPRVYPPTVQKAMPELFLTETGRRSPKRTRPPFAGVRISSLQASHRRLMLQMPDKKIPPLPVLIEKLTRLQTDLIEGSGLTKHNASDIRDPFAPKPRHTGRYDKYNFKFSKFHY